MGINSEELEVTLIGEAPDMDYLGKLMEMVESLIEKTITWQVCSSGAEIEGVKNYSILAEIRLHCD